MNNPCVKACTDELDRAGVPYDVEFTSKHVHIRYGDERQHLHVCSATPSDWRAPLNERSQMRRELRSFGYIGQEEAVVTAASVSLVDGRATCTSLDISESFGKAHREVLRAIDNVRNGCGEEFDQCNFAPIEYDDQKGRKQRAFRLTRDGFSLVAMGFTGQMALEWKVKYISAFNAMETELSRLSHAAVDLAPLREEMDAVVSMIADVEARIPLPAPPAEPSPYWLFLSRMERRKMERRMRRRAAA